MLHALAAIAGVFLLAAALLDAFNAIVVPRRSEHPLRIANLFYKLTWPAYSALARRIDEGRRRENILGAFGPLSLLILITVWAIVLILAFALMQWAAGFQGSPGSGFGVDLYVSATTLFTVSTGDPSNVSSRFLTGIEAGLGLSFLGLVISYLPVLYQSFSRREIRISLLDSRAGSPPTASGLLKLDAPNSRRVENDLASWESWSAELLQSQIAYPMLAYFRSQHPNQSWLTAQTAVLDAAAVLLLCAEDTLKEQATLTFAMGRHALADMCLVFSLKPVEGCRNRLEPAEFDRFHRGLEQTALPLRLERLSESALDHLRELYEPSAQTLSDHLMMSLPPWTPRDATTENWRNPAINSNPENGFTVSDPFRDR